VQAGHIFTFPKEFHILLSCFFFRFPPTAKQFHFGKQQQQKRNNYDPVPFSIRRKSLPRSRKFRQKEKHSLGALRTKFLFFFCISWRCFFLFCFFPNCWRSSVESLLHRNKRKKESVIYLPRLIGLPSVF
jgi:hypothetical protein